MTDERLYRDILAELQEIPLIDTHTHLVGSKLSARGLHDILLYHMAISDLYAAGCPNGARLTQYPGWPTVEEAHGRILQALPYLPEVRNTSISWGIRLILKDLYDWEAPINAQNWRDLDAVIRERADDRTAHRDMLQRANIRHCCTELARREGGHDDDLLSYSLEWGFFTRCQWNEYDTALNELERCWGKSPESPLPIGATERPAAERVISTLDDVHAAIAHYVSAIPFDRIGSMATHISTDLDLQRVSAAQMRDALQRRRQAGPEERDIFASYINEALLQALTPYADQCLFCFSLGAEPLPYETASRLSQRTIAQLAEMMSRHPQLRFQCMVASRHANQSLCTLARELPNFSLAGYWWHNFFPAAIRQVIEERLDMLPANKNIAFFSDAYCVEWAYAKAQMVRTQLALVLAQKVACGQYTRADALLIARQICYESARRLLQLDRVEAGW